MPKKAVAIFFLSAFICAAIFVYFTFPRTKEEIPRSNNQRPFPSSPGPNGVPVPETVPHPNTPKLPPGPTLRVMAWASATEAKTIETEADAFATASGRQASLTIESDPVVYRRDLRQALASDTPPDVCLIDARDFSGIDPARDLADATPDPGTAPRSIAAFTVGGDIKAAPDEFSVEVLFYNPGYFDQAGLGYPGEHWTWDMLEADARALDALQLKDDSGQSIYPLELPADFDFWNILCAETGHPALDLDTWHLADAGGKDSQMRALELIHDLFQGLSVTAPLPKNHEAPGRFFAQQRAALLVASSDFRATLPPFRYAFTVLPRDLTRASMARINGWAVTARSSQQGAARALAGYLAYQPVHAGWTSVQTPTEADTPDALCHAVLAQALLPRIDSKTAALAQFLDQQIDQLARHAQQTPDAVYARIQAEDQKGASSLPSNGELPQAGGLNGSKPKATEKTGP